MSTGFASDLQAFVLTVSDSCFKGTKKDLSGPTVADLLEQAGITTVTQGIVPDEVEIIAAALRQGAAAADIIITTGGTGLAPRDVTPEATRMVCERLVEGLAERMRAIGATQTPLAALSPERHVVPRAHTRDAPRFRLPSPLPPALRQP